jgi:hypothetical protein
MKGDQLSGLLGQDLMKGDQLSELLGQDLMGNKLTGENKAPYIQNLGSGQLVVGNTMEKNGTRENYQTEKMWPNW